ncbi:hypothetical protein T439DRAFT_377868 [Meredithblackwellia eburnea MCA 4105]
MAYNQGQWPPVPPGQYIPAAPPIPPSASGGGMWQQQYDQYGRPIPPSRPPQSQFIPQQPLAPQFIPPPSTTIMRPPPQPPSGAIAFSGGGISPALLFQSNTTQIHYQPPAPPLAPPPAPAPAPVLVRPPLSISPPIIPSNQQQQQHQRRPSNTSHIPPYFSPYLNSTLDTVQFNRPQDTLLQTDFLNIFTPKPPQRSSNTTSPDSPTSPHGIPVQFPELEPTFIAPPLSPSPPPEPEDDENEREHEYHDQDENEREHEYHDQEESTTSRPQSIHSINNVPSPAPPIKIRESWPSHQTQPPSSMHNNGSEIAGEPPFSPPTIPSPVQIPTPPSGRTSGRPSPTPSFKVHQPPSDPKPEDVELPSSPRSQGQISPSGSVHSLQQQLQNDQPPSHGALDHRRQSLEVPGKHRRTGSLSSLKSPPPPTSPKLQDEPSPAPSVPSPPPQPKTLQVPDNIVYSYALRVAILDDLLSRPPIQRQTPSPGIPSSSTSPSSHTHTFSLDSTAVKSPTLLPAAPPHPTLSRSLSSSTGKKFLKDFKDTSRGFINTSKDKLVGNSSRFPASAIRGLEVKLQRVGSGADAISGTSDFEEMADFRTAVNAFTNVLMDNHNTLRTNFKNKGDVGELTGVFMRTAAESLARSGRAGGGRVQALVALFAGVVSDFLKSLGEKGEVLNRLDEMRGQYKASSSGTGRVERTTSVSSQTSARRVSDAGSKVAGGPDGGGGGGGGGGFAPTPSTGGFDEMRLVKVVGQLFKVDPEHIEGDVRDLRDLCTERAAYNDLRRCITNATRGTNFTPSSRNDFDSDAPFAQWRKEENVQLSDMILNLCNRNPSLRSADIDLSRPLVYVPSEPRATYARLVEFAMRATLAEEEAEGEESSMMGVLSSDLQALLDACAVRWRLIVPVKVNAVLDAVVEMECPLAFVRESLDGLEVASVEWEYSRWPWKERVAVYTALRALFDNLLPLLAKIFQGALKLSFSDVLDPIQRICDNEVFQEDARDLSQVFDSLTGRVGKLVTMAYAKKKSEREEENKELPSERALDTVLDMLEWVMKECKRYSKAFPSLLFGKIDVPAIFIGTASPLFIQHLVDIKPSLEAAAVRAPGAAPDSDLLDLYNNTAKVQKMHDSFCPESPLQVPFNDLFGGYVRRWIAQTADTMIRVWVPNAVQRDTFKLDPESEQMYTTSVPDIVDGCKGAISTLLGYKWPNELEHAQFVTRLSQAICNAIQSYARMLQDQFMHEVYPPAMSPTDEDTLFSRAKLALNRGQKIVPYVFEEKTLVKLNNIEAIRSLLDNMSQSLKSDAAGEVLDKFADSIPPEEPRWLFSIKIVSGEKLVPADGPKGRVDAWVGLSDPGKYQIAQTRTVDDNPDPMWEQSFDLLLKNELVADATVYNRVVGDVPDVLGRARFILNPPEFVPLVRKELVLKLEETYSNSTPSKITVRVRMEPHKDDVRFYFGRAFRALKRSEKEMGRALVTRMIPVIRYHLSMTTLRTLIRNDFVNTTMNVNRVRLTSAATTATTSISAAASTLGARMNRLLEGTPEELIPEVAGENDEHEQGRAGAQGAGILSSDEVQHKAVAPLEPLVDYLNEALATLANTLSAGAWSSVSERLWREVLMILENLILPPLSDEPTDMKPLGDKELEIVYRWLQFMVDFFYADGEGLEKDKLYNAKHSELLLARMYYDMNLDDLYVELTRSMQRRLSKDSTTSKGVGRSKSVYLKKDIKTMKAVAKDKKSAMANENLSGPVILRILRMRPGQQEFVKQQIRLLNIPPEASAERTVQGRRQAAFAGKQGLGLKSPPMPAIPDHLT